MNLLSVDMDFWFPIPEHDPEFLYDWGHRESPFFITDIWPIRAEAFQRRAKPLPAMDPSWHHFWEQFRFAKGVRLYYGESHLWAADTRISRGIRSVWNYDAHHDCGYGPHAMRLFFEGQLDCGSWMLDYWARGATTHVRYPLWRPLAEDRQSAPAMTPTTMRMAFTDEPEELPVFDRIFLARSGAWTPPWGDDDFFAFLDLCPAKRKVDIGAEYGRATERRPFTQQMVDDMAAQLVAGSAGK